jgi:uncharacterized protein YkwD
MPDITALVSQLSQLHFGGGNILDIIIILIIIFYLHEGYSVGFVIALSDLLSFVCSFVVALRFYAPVSQMFMTLFSLPIGVSKALSFFLIAFVAEILLGIFFRHLAARLPRLPAVHPVSKQFKKMDHWLGILPGLVSAFILLSFLLTVIVSLPSSPLVKHLVTGSVIGEKLVANTSLFEKRLDDIFGGALNETINFLTVEPRSDEVVALHFKVDNGTPDGQAEQQMFRMVNTERAQNGLPPVFFDLKLQAVARAHSDDMLKRGYFSHFTPEGLSPFDRMKNAGITFLSAGENLALAPSTELAMQGLMNSPGHRANILSPNFGKIGIGVIDAGIYGKMYSQEFTD